MTGLVIFGLLCALMITGMPISIALGLTVLTFLFTMTDVPLESVALKLFTGIEKFEIMAIPFFILAGNFLTHGGVAKRMIRFATALVGHLHGGLALGGVVACALFAAVSGSSPATVVAIGSILLPAMVKQGYPKKFGVGVIAHRRRARHPDPAVDRDGHLCGVDQLVDRASCSSPASSPACCSRCCCWLSHGWWPRSATTRACRGRASRRCWRRVPRERLGAVADRRRHRRHLHRHFHADRGGGDERGLCVLRRRCSSTGT